jgi:DNA-binding MarR family transcriptional regulator
LSSDFQEKRPELLGELTKELRQFHGLSASFFRVATNRVGMTVTDMQVIDILDTIGPITAGQLADLTGLTTGAITGMINRLEEAGFVRRERDLNDGRRVIVQLIPDKDKMHEVSSIFDSIEKSWNEIVASYDNEQLALLVRFLKQSNASSRQRIVQLRETPEGEGNIYSASMGDIKNCQLIVSAGVSQLTVLADDRIEELYQARFKGSVPDMKVKDNVVTVRYPRRLWVMDKSRTAEITLNSRIPWQIMIQGGLAMVTAELDNLNLVGLEIKGGLSSIRLKLPKPSGIVPIKISGAASEIIIRRPVGTSAQVHLKGWVSEFIFDDQNFSDMGTNIRLQSRYYKATDPYYDIEVAS